MQGGVFLKNKVEQLRKERGLNQDDFAKMLRVSRQTISSIETGKYNPSLETSLDKGTQRKTTENELPSLTQCTA